MNETTAPPQPNLPELIAMVRVASDKLAQVTAKLDAALAECVFEADICGPCGKVFDAPHHCPHAAAADDTQHACTGRCHRIIEGGVCCGADPAFTDVTTDEPMKPCPFCGGPPVLILRDALTGSPFRGNPMDGANAANFFSVSCKAAVFCHECGAESPAVEDHVSSVHYINTLLRRAAKLWNLRDERHVGMYQVDLSHPSSELLPICESCTGRGVDRESFEDCASCKGTGAANG